VSGLPPKYVEKIRAMLSAIFEAESLAKIEKYYGWRLHPLKGNRHGTWSMTVTRNHRLTFRLLDLNVVEVDLEDYHGR
jgi:proteic killer suppression protein